MTFEYMSLRRASLATTGFDISREKYADISKDWLDKQGDLSFGNTDKMVILPEVENYQTSLT